MSESSDVPAVPSAAGLPGIAGARPLSAPAADPGRGQPAAEAGQAAARAGPSLAEAVSTADDAAWSTLFGATEVGSTPYSVAVDGDVVYLGGDFTGVMAGMPQDTYLRIARWDGRSWSRLGEGLDGTVHAICVVGDAVFVGGEFSVAGGSTAAARLARWDGEGWSDVGGGVSYADVPSMAVVRVLASDGDRLYVAGTFDRVGRGDASVVASGLAAFDLRSGTW